MSILTKTLPLFLAGAMLAGTAQAGYRMTAFGNVPGFEEIMAENYDRASALLQAGRFEASRYARLANLCVSQLLSYETEEAMRACERALTAAPAELRSALAPSPLRRAGVMTHLYSNRGVVKAVNGDLLGARADFERALALDAGNANARLNLEYTSGRELAQQE